MILPPLTPRPRAPITPVAPTRWLVPTQDEWAVAYSELERLYVRERRKLRYIMQYMESEYGFKATQQMYKKRFAKWGFQKNFRRSTATVTTLTTDRGWRRASSRKSAPLEYLASLPPSPGSGRQDELAQMVLLSVRTCSTAFFESAQPCEGLLATVQHSPLPGDLWYEQTQDISFTFKLVIGLLDRGHGELAGRVARKAFLLVEDMFRLEGPALVWNLFEVMHNMVTLRHVQLFRMLLAHLIALSESRFQKTHPFSAMLHGLRGLVATPGGAEIAFGSPAPSSFSSSGPFSSTSPSSNSEGTPATVGNQLSECTLSAMLERAWSLNAEMLFTHFDSRLFPLYCQVHWESCSLAPPAAILDAATQWFSQIETQTFSGAIEWALRADYAGEATPIEQDKMLRHLRAPRMDASPPRDFEMLRASSFAALQEHGDSIVNRSIDFTDDTAYQLLRILAALVTIKVFKDSGDIARKPTVTGDASTKVRRKQAGHLACAMGTLLHLKTDGGGEGTVSPSEVVAQVRSIIALREYARGERSPQLVRDMWQLQNALTAAGEPEEAQEVGRDAFCRLEKYIQDIPVDFV